RPTAPAYLPWLGTAAVAGAGVAYAAGALTCQAIVAAVVAVAGIICVNRYKKTVAPKRMQGLDVGQPAVFDTWINKSAGHARVKYRDALWDAHIAGEAAGEPN